VLGCHEGSLAEGMATLRPAELVELLDQSGELEETVGGPECPAPGLAVISRLYGAFAPA
jgi:hypothetical protein